MSYAPGHDKKAVDLCEDFIDGVEEALGLIYSKDDKDREEGEEKIKIVLLKLTGLLLDNDRTFVRVYPKLDLWSFQVTFGFDMMYNSPGQVVTYSRSTSCIDAAKNPRKAAEDLCLNTVSCVVAVTRSFVQDIIKSPEHDDMFYCMHFVAGHLSEPYL